jgi:signal transduction histidine kinase
LTKIACQLLNVPMSVVSLVDKERQWFKSCVGVDESETPRAPSFCSYTILSDRVLNVPDATQDPRFSDSALVTGPPFIRFYLGVPLRSSSGFNIGSFCAMSTEPKIISEAEMQMARDLAAMVSSELELRLALKRLKESHVQMLHMEKMSSIGRLATGLSHEINTPMQFISSNAQFLEESFLDLKGLVTSYTSLATKLGEKGLFPEECDSIREQEKEMDLPFLVKEVPVALEQTLKGISRVRGLVTAMQTFSAPGQEQMSQADLNQGIEATVAISHNEWSTNSKLVTTLDKNLPLVPCILGDMNQVILGMIDNSVDSIQEAIDSNRIKEGLIRITTARAGDQALIVIEDNGAGIPTTAISKVFDPFFTTKKIGKGTGQGLAIAHDIIVNKHQGTVQVASEPGEGSSFCITIPLGNGALAA